MENSAINLKEWSIIKKILLFLNVSAYRASVNSPFNIAYSRKSRHMAYGAILNVFFFISIYSIIFSTQFPVADEYFKYFVVALIAYFGAIFIIFDKDIVVASVAYNHYYNNLLYNLFRLYMLVGIVCGLILFYNSIGK
ncbi:hypothetical protein FFF34_001230 [Inquilinus sp. KBS0705]|nr:hypothetical protein FFF34_001230 [Inquilinus sp. KBS0705]